MTPRPGKARVRARLTPATGRVRRWAIYCLVVWGAATGPMALALETGPAIATPDTAPTSPIEWVAELPDGSVNWTAGTARAAGQNEPAGKTLTEEDRRQALDRAATHARRRLFQTVLSLPVAHGRTVSQTIAQDPAMMVKLKDTMDAAGVIDTVYLSDGTVRVTVEASLRDGFAQLLLPPSIQSIDSIRSATAPAIPQASAPCPQSRTAADSSGPYTGLIIDARHIDALPAMAFTIHDETGRIVYGDAFVSREYAVQHGMGRYWSNPESAQASGRVCPNPIRVRALRATGSGRSDFVISTSDAGRLISAAEHVAFFRECRVAIILSPATIAPPVPPKK